MSSKRQRGDGSTSQASKSYDKQRFVSKAASEQYYSLLVSKELVPERGIKPYEIQDNGVADMIKERGWENLTQ